jgi:hypothetical protein
LQDYFLRLLFSRRPRWLEAVQQARFSQLSVQGSAEILISMVVIGATAHGAVEDDDILLVHGKAISRQQTIRI